MGAAPTRVTLQYVGKPGVRREGSGRVDAALAGHEEASAVALRNGVDLSYPFASEPQVPSPVGGETAGRTPRGGVDNLLRGALERAGPDVGYLSRRRGILQTTPQPCGGVEQVQSELVFLDLEGDGSLDQRPRTALGGDAVFCRNWPSLYGSVGDPESSRLEPEQVGIAPLPAGEGGESASGLGGWNFFINAGSDDDLKDAGYEFVRFMTAPEQQRSYALGGSYLPTRAALYEDRQIIDAIPVVELAPEALARTRPRPRSPYYSDMSLRMAEQFNNVVAGDVEPQSAASTLQEQLQQIVDQGQA